MTTQAVTPVIKTANFTTATPNRENATRERKAARLLRAKALFSGKIEFLGRLDASDAEALSKGEALATPAGKLSIKTPGPAKCALCGGVHNMTTYDSGAKIPSRAMLTTWFKKGANVFALSDTCRQDYFDAHAATVLSNPDTYRIAYPKAPVKA